MFMHFDIKLVSTIYFTIINQLHMNLLGEGEMLCSAHSIMNKSPYGLDGVLQ
jgi:hypothetical protein